MILSRTIETINLVEFEEKLNYNQCGLRTTKTTDNLVKKPHSS